ncbi:MAG: hypothetical protein J6X92_03335 [Bacteroidales bacterium]|nr:hypothetical protein [Bacteroidales bacterium]
MKKLDKTVVGIIAGLILPFIVALIVFLSAKGEPNLKAWMMRINLAHIETHIISLCVFSNIVLFFIFNRLDMLRATRGVLAITILWAFLVFGIKFF